MVDDKEDIERSEVPGRNYEEIHGCSLRSMKVEKALPVPFGTVSSFRHVSAHGVDVHMMPAHPQLAEDALRPPRRVLGGHTDDLASE